MLMSCFWVILTCLVLLKALASFIMFIGHILPKNYNFFPSLLYFQREVIQLFHNILPNLDLCQLLYSL